MREKEQRKNPCPSVAAQISRRQPSPRSPGERAKRMDDAKWERGVRATGQEGEGMGVFGRFVGWFGWVSGEAMSRRRSNNGGKPKERNIEHGSGGP